jgi:hypothetical protein
LSAKRQLGEITMCERPHGPDDPITLHRRGNLARLYQASRRLTEASKIYADIIEHSRRVRGEEHPQTVLLLSNLAGAYVAAHREAAVLPVFRRSSKLRRGSWERVTPRP